MIIGISGKSGSGKSTLSNLLLEKYKDKLVYLEIDKVGHNALLREDAKEEVINAFGNAVIIDGKVDRKKVGDIVFNNRKEMDKLTNITWNYMQIEIDNFLDKNKDKIIILDWLLLPISKYFDMCDIKIVLDIPYEVRKERAMKRDNITEEKFDLRENASIDLDINKFDLVIKDNDVIKKLVMNL